MCAAPLSDSTSVFSFRVIEQIPAADLPYKTFLSRYVHANRPVVITNVAPQWPAMSRWTPDYFRDLFGPLAVPIAYDKTMPFTQFINEMLASAPGQPGPYMFRLFLHQHLPQVLADLAPQSRHAFPRRLASPLVPHGWRRPDGFLKLLMGGPGSSFPAMHFDANAVHATVTEIYGDKEFIMFAPEDTPYLYADMKSPNKSQVFDPTNPDLTRFPLLAKATPYRMILKPGSMVFIPRGWWHTARPITHSISIGMNIVDGSNWKAFVSDILACDARNAGYLRWLKAQIEITAYLLLGSFMSALELLQDKLPTAAKVLRFPVKLCPASADMVVADPSMITIHERSRQVG